MCGQEEYTMDEQEKNSWQDGQGEESAAGAQSGEQKMPETDPYVTGEDGFYAYSKIKDDEDFYSSQKVNYYDTSGESDYSPYSSASQQAYDYYPDEEKNKKKDKKKKKDNNGSDKKTGKIILIVVIAVIVALCGVLGWYYVKHFRGGLNPAQTPANKEGDAQLLISESNIADVDSSDGLSAEEIYSKNIKSNVGIILYGSTSSFFTQNNGSSSSSVAGEGSGIIMGENKDKTKTYIITCAHVIESANSSGYKVVVQDYKGDQYDAVVVGYDSKTDIGVLSIEQTGLTAAEFGDSAKLKIGETVYAIGNPGGTEFFGSYTKGMVSAIDRPVSNEIGYDMKCIQHDAAINPGNSGGMLINSAGQVVGINSSKIASTEYEGMGFAIPISSAKTIVDDLIANGYVTNRPKLGISYAPVSQYQIYSMIAHYKNLPAGSLIIMDINSESAFSGTDAKEGDLIIAVDGKDMETADVLLDKIENGKVGDSLKLTLCRIDEKTYDIKKFDVTVKLIEDKGTNETTQQQQNGGQSYEDYFNQFFGGGF